MKQSHFDLRVQQGRWIRSHPAIYESQLMEPCGWKTNRGPVTGDGGGTHCGGSRCKSLSEEVTFELRSQGGERGRDDHSRPGSLKHGTGDAWDHLLWWRGSPVHRRMLSSIPGLYTLDAGGTLPFFHPQVETTKDVSRHCHMSSRWGRLKGAPGGEV